MKRLDTMARWLSTNSDLAYPLIRIYVGLALFVRGLLFLTNPTAITELVDGHSVYWWYSLIIGTHLLGGAFLAIGFLTRIGALLQIPILVGAIAFIHLGEGLMTVGQSLELASLVLVLLLVFFLFGSGRLSVDHELAKRRGRSTHSDQLSVT